LTDLILTINIIPALSCKVNGITAFLILAAAAAGAFGVKVYPGMRQGLDRNGRFPAAGNFHDCISRAAGPDLTDY
jgi:hypothetical protein